MLLQQKENLGIVNKLFVKICYIFRMPGAIYYFVYEKLYNEVYIVLQIDDVAHFLLTYYCGDVINKFTCPSKELHKCIEEKTKHLPLRCINHKNDNHYYGSTYKL